MDATKIYVKQLIPRNFLNNEKLKYILSFGYINFDGIIDEFIRTKNITITMRSNDIEDAFEEYLDSKIGGKKYKKSKKHNKKIEKI